MRLRAALTAVTVTALIGATGTGLAQASTTTSGGFEGFAYDDINQQGWQKTGPYDVAVVDPHDFGVTDMGAHALRLSNAVVSGSFGDQTFSAPTTDEAGETTAASDAWSGGTRQRFFTASFSFRSTSSAEQPGLYTSVSPDRGDGARMSYLRFEDQTDGVHVFFDDVSGTAASSIADFHESDIATLARSSKHSIVLTLQLVDGPSNDVARVWVDGALRKTGTSWEDYYRYDAEGGGGTRTVDSLLFREGGSATDARPALAGKGFLVDDVVLTTGSATPCTFINSGTTMTLVSDCSTASTIHVPQGFTLDGAGHTITAVDPPGGHFTGAVVQNSGTSANVANLGVTAGNLADVCDAYPDSLAGIRLDGASGSVTSSTVHDLNQASGTSGCQEGQAIEIRNTAGTGTPRVTVSGNTATAYQKTGVLVRDGVDALVTGNTVAGYGPTSVIAENGIQVSYGATAALSGNTIRDNFYTPKTYAACGVIIYKAGGVRVAKDNVFTGNERDTCVSSKGGTYDGVSP